MIMARTERDELLEKVELFVSFSARQSASIRKVVCVLRSAFSWELPSVCNEWESHSRPPCLRGDSAQHMLRYEVHPTGTPRMTTTYAIAIIVRLTNQLTSSYSHHLYKTHQCLTSNILLCVPNTSDNLWCVPDHIHHCVSCTLISYVLHPFHPHLQFLSVIPLY